LPGKGERVPLRTIFSARWVNLSFWQGGHKKERTRMPDTTWQDLDKHMQVLTKDAHDLGHTIELYEDSFLVRKEPLGKHLYFPYHLMASIADRQVHLTLSADEAAEPRWQKRPDYENHLGDPTQIMYDRGHGAHDPFDPDGPAQG
jgi:hypothetical protein